MFAYCPNNPIQRSDPTGDASIIPLPTLRDYYNMHKAVQYDIVENVNNSVDNSQSIEELAKAVIRGEYGNGQERKNRLGNLYNEVQARVNEILRG